MAWDKPYIVVRVDSDGSASVVHSAAMIKDARYWLQYIALPGDALFQTPLHPKCAGKTEPCYYAHLKARGKIEHDEKSWAEMALKGKPLKLEAAVAA